MFSILKPSLVYTNISQDILEHDIDFEASEWVYDSKSVFRGSFDPEYSDSTMNVHWLYDDNLKRIGLVEHEIEHPEVFKTLWIHDNPFSTLFQDTRWKTKNETLWSLLSNEAYQDCLESDFKSIFDDCLASNVFLTTPTKIMEKQYEYYECVKCGKKSFSVFPECEIVKKTLDFSIFSILFIDDSFVLYQEPTGFSLMQEQLDASSEVHQELPVQESLTLAESYQVSDTADDLVPESPQADPPLHSQQSS